MAELSVPPHDLDAEAAVLGAVMLGGNEVLDQVADLRPEMFYAEAHRRVHEACLALQSTGRPLDIVQVMTALREGGRLDQVGGRQYLTEILDAAAAIAHAPAYAATVRDRWRRRETIALCQRVVAEGYHGAGDTDELVATLAEGSARLSRGVGVDRLRKMVDVTKAVVRGIKETHARGVTPGVRTGIAELDRILGGLHDGEVTIVAGRPGTGKSSLCFEACASVADPTRPESERGGAVAFSLEMPSEQVCMRHLATRAGVPVGALRAGNITEQGWGRLMPAAVEVSKLPYWVDDTPSATISYIRRKVAQAQSEAKKLGLRIRLIVIDYAQLARSSGRTQNREGEVSEISRGTKELAKEIGCPVMLLAQLNRSVEERSDKRPILKDLRESGSLEQDADNVVFIYRDELYDKRADPDVAELIIAKQRAGPTGTIFVGWNGERTSFFNLPPDRLERLKEAASR